MGCDLMQGYLLSRPLPAEDLLAWLPDKARRATGDDPGQPADETGLASTPIPSSSTSTR